MAHKSRQACNANAARRLAAALRRKHPTPEEQRATAAERQAAADERHPKAPVYKDTPPTPTKFRVGTTYIQTARSRPGGVWRHKR